MAVTIGSNISALQAQRHLARSTEGVSATSERLASGLRINRASDDAAGLAISSSLRADSRVFAQGIRNINDGVSALNIAQGSLQQLSDIVTRQMELAEQAANGTYSTTQRDGLQDEADALTSEFNRILGTTSFNGINLFQNPSNPMQLQAGYGNDGILSSYVGRQLSRRQGDGTFGSASNVSAVGVGNQSVVTADFNGDGNADLYIARGFSDARVYLGNGDGTFRQAQNMGTATVGTFAYTSDINGDGKLDLIDMHFTSGNINIKLGNGDGTFLAPTTVTAMQDEGTNIRFGDINSDGRMDMLVTHATNTNNTETWLGNGDGTFSYGMSFGPGNGYNNTGSSSLLADFDNDGKLDIILGYFQNAKFLKGNGDGSFAAAVTVPTFGTGTAITNMQVADVNRDGKLDFIANDANGYTSILMGNGDGTFAAFRTIATGAGVALANMAFADMNNDGFLDIVMRSGTTNAVTHFWKWRRNIWKCKNHHVRYQLGN